jgi:protein ImuB
MFPPDKTLAVSAAAAPTPSRTRAPESVDAPAQQSLLPEHESPLEPRSGAGIRPCRLWLCLHFPRLPLEAASGRATPRAVFEESHGIRRILMLDGAARAMGVLPGLSVNAALALVPGLELEQRDPAREAQVLKALAGWAERFTSMVSLEPPALLLEIAGSLRLFGGLETLLRRIELDLEERGFSAATAVAPTPLASMWLARAGRNACVRDLKHLTGTIASLPLRCLEWPESVEESLNGMGLTCIGDCLRLPRQGFARRFGAGLLLELDRALARLPDPRVSYRAPERFTREYDLHEELHDSELLQDACRQLLRGFERFLTSRQLAVQQVRFSFFHLRGQATHLTLRRRRAGGAVEQWSELLALRFERMALPAPVIAIRLRGGHGEPLQAMNDALPFDGKTGKSGRLPVAHLMERLCARMGDDAVHGVALVAEHRPQHAWCPIQAIDSQVSSRMPQCPAALTRAHDYQPQWQDDLRRTHRLLLRRPLWMLPEPMLLDTIGNDPSYHGALQRVSGPERIESGWWDTDGIARDYFVAVNSQGVHLWIYRNRSGRPDWYLHGIFG